MYTLLTLPGGWYPKFNPDGTRLCFGFGRVGWVEVRAGAAPQWVVDQGFQGGWLDTTRIACLVGKDQQFGLWEYSTAEQRLRVIDSTQRASAFEASLGHWACARNGIGQLTYDGQVYTDRQRSGVSLYGDRLVSSLKPLAEGQPWLYEERVAGVVSRTYDPPGQQNEWRMGEDGWLGYGYFGRARVVSPNDPPEFVDVSVVPLPNGAGTSGEGVPYVFRARGDLWCISGCEVGTERFMALRPLSSPTTIKIPAPAVRPSAYYDARTDRILVAGESDRGLCTVWAVSPDEPRQKIQPPPPSALPFGPCWHGYYFKYSQRYGSNASAPGNSSVIVEPGLVSLSGESIVAIGALADTGEDLIAEWAPVWHRVCAVVCAHESSAIELQRQVDAARARMRQLGLPRRAVVVYSARHFWPQVDAESYMVEAYQDASETLSSAYTRWRQRLIHINEAGFLPALASADYDRAGRLTEQQLLDAQAAYAELGASCRFWFRFSDGRPGGTRDHEVLRPWHHATADVCRRPTIQDLPWPAPPIDPPIPPKPQPPMLIKTLLAFTQKYVCAEIAGYLVANREVAAGWEHFKFHPKHGKYVIQTDHGSFLTADIDGTFRMNEPYTSPAACGAWEEYTLEGGEGGGIAIRTHHGTLMTVNDDQSVTHKAREHAGINETFNLSVPAPGPGPGTPLVEPIRAQGKRLVQGDGRAFRWRGITSFRLLHMITTGEDARGVIEEVQGLGFNLVRVLVTAKHLFDLPAERGRAALPTLLSLLREMRMAAEVVALADTLDWTREALRQQLQSVYATCMPFGLALVEGGNEIGPIHGTQHPDSAKVCRDFRPSMSGTPYCPGSVHGDAFCHDLSVMTEGQRRLATEQQIYPYWDEISTYGWSYGTSHLQRRENRYDRVRRSRELELMMGDAGCLFVDDEPMGADETYRPGKRDNDPGAFFAQGILSRVFTIGATFHCEDGLWSRHLQPTQRACADAFLRGATFVPDDITLTFKNTGWGDSPIASFSNAVRVYSGMSASHNLAVVLGYQPSTTIVTKNGWRLGDVLADYPSGCRVYALVR